MTEDLKKLIALAKTKKMSSKEAELQRRSFAYGNTHFENERITRQTVDQAAESLKKKNGSQD